MSDEIDNLLLEVSMLISTVGQNLQSTRTTANVAISSSTPNTSVSITTDVSTQSDGETSLQEINALCDDVDHNLRTAGIHIDGSDGGANSRERQQPAAAAQNEQPIDFIDLSETPNEQASLNSPTSSEQPAIVVDLCTPVRRRRTANSRRNRIYQPRHNSRIPIDVPQPMLMPPIYDDDDGIVQIEVISAPTVPLIHSNHKERDISRDSNNLNDSDAGASVDILKCAVCMESAYKRQPTSTRCGHVFCRECILQALRLTHKCPLCNTKITERTLLRLYV